MATKKTTATAKKKASAKKTPVTRNSVKKSTKATKTSPRSFRLEASTSDFMKPTFTIETIYWIILSMAVVALGFWIATLQMRINAIYDQIDANYVQSENIDVQLRTLERLNAQALESDTVPQVIPEALEVEPETE